MPQPVRKKGFACHAYPKCVLERPKLAALIGTIAAEWGYIDECLVHLYERSITDTLYTDAVAVAVFETLSSLHLKTQLIAKVLKMRLPAAIATEFETTITPSLRNAARERAEILHGAWSVSDHYPDDLILKTSEGPFMRYTEKDLAAVLDRIIPVRNATNNFLVKAANTPKKGK